MAYSAAVVSQTVRHALRIGGVNVAYRGGAWMVATSFGGGSMTPAPPDLARQLDAYAASFLATQLAKAMATRHGITLTPSPSPINNPLPGSPLSYPSAGGSNGGTDTSSPTYIPSANSAYGSGTNRGLSNNPLLPLLRAVTPGDYRNILRRSTQAYRAATIAQRQGMAPGRLGSIGAGLGAGYGIGSDAAGFIGGAFGAVGGAIGGAFGLAGGAIGGGIGAGVGQAAGGIFSLGLGVVATASKLAAAGLVAFVGAIGLAIKATVQFGQSVLTLAQKTGGGYGQAANAIFTAKGFGIGADQLSTDPQWQQRALAGFYGGDASGSIGDVSAFRNRYRSLAARGPSGLMQAQNMADITGKSAYIGVANLPDDLYNQQTSRISAIGRGFNINPDTLARATQNWTLFMSTIETGLSALATKVGTEVLPKIMPVLDKAINWLGNNAGRVSDLIVKGVSAGWEYLKKFAVFLYADVPPAIAGATLSVLQFMKSIRDGAVGLWDSIRKSGIAKALGIDSSGPIAPAATPNAPASNGGGSAWDTVTGWGKTALKIGATYLLGRGALKLLGGPTGNAIGQPIGRAIGDIGRGLVGGLGGGLAGAVGIGTGAAVGTMVYEGYRLYDEWHNGAWGNKHPMPHAWEIPSAAIQAGKDWVMGTNTDGSPIPVPRGSAGASRASGTNRPGDKLDMAVNWASNWAKGVGNADDRRKYAESQMVDLLSSIDKNTAESADAAKGLLSGGPDAMQEIYARAASYVAEDAWINMNRG